MWAACIQAEQQLQQVRSTGERQEAEFAGLQRGIETANQDRAAAQAEVHRYATSCYLCLACRVEPLLAVASHRPGLSVPLGIFAVCCVPQHCSPVESVTIYMLRLLPA